VLEYHNANFDQMAERQEQVKQESIFYKENKDQIRAEQADMNAERKAYDFFHST
jgi:hypothetical protein